MRIATVTLDFWNTLMFEPPAEGDRHRRRRLDDFEAILAAAGRSVDRPTLETAYDASGRYLAAVWEEHRDVPVEDHVGAILAAVAPDLPARLPAAVCAALVEAYARPALLAPPVPAGGAGEALEALAGRGYTLAVVSNAMRTPGAVLRRLLDHHGLLGYFKHTTFSDEVRVRKPAPEIFLITLREVGGQPATAVHVGDDAVLDVEGARAAGMRVVQVSRSPGAGADVTVAGLREVPAAVAGLDAGP